MPAVAAVIARPHPPKSCGDFGAMGAGSEGLRAIVILTAMIGSHVVL